jgi:hypothetical protein
VTEVDQPESQDSRGFRDGEPAHLVAEDATNLRQELGGAFGEAARHS